MRRFIGWAAAFAALVLLAGLPGAGGAVTITIVPADTSTAGFEEGYFDPTPVSPVGGNPGLTLGAQRLNAVQYAANLWGSILPGSIPITIRSTFDNRTCTASSAELGVASAFVNVRNFPGAVNSTTYYLSAIASQLSGTDKSTGDDFSLSFNKRIDQNDTLCFKRTRFYYGYDGLKGLDELDIIPVALHEIAHGLGFTPQVTLSTGAFPNPLEPANPTIYSKFVYDISTGKTWDIMTNSERAASAINNGNVVWNGAAVRDQAPYYVHRPQFVINDPPTVEGAWPFSQADFGGVLGNPNVSANIVQALDAVGTSTDACSPLTNASAIAGKIAFVDRGPTCEFDQKAANVQAAGGVGMIIANNVTGPIPEPLGGFDPSIKIPVIGISQADGNTLRAQLANGLNGFMGASPTLLIGTDASNRIQLHAPTSLSSASSISHWTPLTYPNLLMEPNLSQQLFGVTDITRHLFRDVGWFNGTTITGVPEDGAAGNWLRAAPNPSAGPTAIHFTLDRQGPMDLQVFDVAGRQVRRLARRSLPAGQHFLVWDGLDEQGTPVGPGVYLVRARSLETDRTVRVVRVR